MIECLSQVAADATLQLVILAGPLASDQIPRGGVVDRSEIKMPRYYFHLEENGHRFVDRDGIELTDVEEAREEAVTGACELMSENVLRRRAADGRRFVITDEDGTVVAENPLQRRD